ncbi:MAG: BatD family protein [Candidatus Omnitrophota bacterium]
MKNLILSAGIGILIITLFIGIITVFAQDQKTDVLLVRVSVSLDKRVVTLGEKIKYTVTLASRKDVDVEFPAAAQTLGDFTVKDAVLKSSVVFGKKRSSFRYILEAYTTGKLTIPKMVIKYKGKADKDWREVTSDEQIVEVKSLLAKAKDMTDIRDIKGLVMVSAAKMWFVLTGGILLVVCLLFLLKFLKKNKTAPLLPVRAAHEIAFEQLQELQRKDLISQGKIKEYFIEVSGIVRHYLENRFNLKAPEMTTEEFLIHLRDGTHLRTEHKTLLKDFLVACDLVKFAKYAPNPQEIDKTFQFARNFVEQTKEQA